MEKFRWGLLGPGRIAENFARALTVVDDAELYAVASRDRQRADEFAAKYGAKVSYQDYSSLAADQRVDAIYIATPHRFHFEQIKMCLLAGKPVLCEKPLTVNAQQSEQLMRLARAQNVFLMEAFWTRFLPVYQHVKTWLNEGAIGRVRSLSSSFGFCASRDLEDRLYNRELAGGALLDIGVYNIGISQWVYGQAPQAIQASAWLAQTKVDEHTMVNLQYSDTRSSQFTCSFLAKHNNDFCIFGDLGQIRIHNMFWSATSATLETAEQTITIDEPFRATGFEYEIEEAMRCIRGGLLESPVICHDETLTTMKIMDEIRRQIGLTYPFE